MKANIVPIARLGLGVDHVFGGHLHIAGLEFYPEDETLYIDEDLQKHRRVTVDQTVDVD